MVGLHCLLCCSFFQLFSSVHYCNYVLCRASRSNFTARTREPKYRKNLWKCEKMSWKERQQLTEACVWLTGVELELRVWEQIARILTFLCFFFIYTAATVHIQCCVVTFLRQLRKVSCCDREKVNWGLVQTTTSQNLRTLCCDGAKNTARNRRRFTLLHRLYETFNEKWESSSPSSSSSSRSLLMSTQRLRMSRETAMCLVSQNKLILMSAKKKSWSWAFYDSSLSFSSG